MAVAPRQWGCTPPISMAMPAPEEIAANDSLIAELRRENNYESPEETQHRVKLLKFIQTVTIEFVKTVTRKKGYSATVVEQAGGKIFTYGSYRLGVYNPGSDIDTLIVTPKHVYREDFFNDFPATLERLAAPGAIEELTPVPDAFVPIIKLELSGISFDLLFARVLASSVPLNFEVKGKDLLRGMEEKDIRALNGTRVTDEILELVPQPKTFRTALRAIKLWAQRRAIYANVMGFPGGVAWAMLVARVCQLYPQATGAVIVNKFFQIMTKWNWPTPIQLKPTEDGPLNVRVWNPSINRSDAAHLMPVITPAYPAMCATHNISQSTKKVILHEMDRAGEIIDKVLRGVLPWSTFFTRHTFFTQDYQYYLSVVASSTNKEAQAVWSGTVESKVRHLVLSIERDPVASRSIEIAHPYTKGFERTHHCRTENEIQLVKKGSMAYQAKGTKTGTTDETNDPKHAAAMQNDAENAAENMPMPSNQEIEAGVTVIYTTTYYIGLQFRKDAQKEILISKQIQQFRNMCFESKQFSEEVNDLTISTNRNFELPDDVFEPGEIRPTKAVKKKTTVVKKGAANGVNSGGRADPAPKKRPIDSVEGPVANGIKRRASATANTPRPTPA